MKKKIKDLTKEDVLKICRKYSDKRMCCRDGECPLYKRAFDSHHECMWLYQDEFKDKDLEKEVEVDE